VQITDSERDTRDPRVTLLSALKKIEAEWWEPTEYRYGYKRDSYAKRHVQHCSTIILDLIKLLNQPSPEMIAMSEETAMLLAATPGFNIQQYERNFPMDVFGGAYVS